MIPVDPPPPQIDTRRRRADNWLVAALCFALAVALGLTWAGFSNSTASKPRFITAAVAVETAPKMAPVARVADFGAEKPSPDARHVADWIAASAYNGGMEFFTIDKKSARLYAFDADARLRDTSAVLLGLAVGDDSVPGIGTRPIAKVKPYERTTPAGRFVAQRGHNTQKEDVVWVDYDAAVSMHRVRTTNPRDKRLERLATATVADNRISYGCINVPAEFYNTYV
ncbi:MAG: hypothetical protein LH481_09675 [Burkholderiales bacterium]|nr:hypothetical protein [Burkholderiales bacterium]